MTPKSKFLLTFALVSGLLLAGLLAAQEQSERRGQKASPSSPAGTAAVERGEAEVTLSRKVQARLGLVVETLEGTAARKQLRATAVVLPADELVRLRASYVAAQAKLETARAKAEVTGEEYRRLERLYADNRNASLKAVQAAEAEWRASRAAERAAQQELTLANFAARQSWGSVVAGWVKNDSPELERVLDGRERLVQVTLPPGAAFVRPARAVFETPGGSFFGARLVSLFPRTDPRIQGISLLYRAPTQPAIAPGVSLAALLAEGGELRGTVIPEQALVWKDGGAWLYQETSPGRFRRRPVKTDFPVENGYFVQGFAPGNRIVVVGAEALLAAEAGPRKPTEEGED